MIRAYRLSTGADGRSHVTRGRILSDESLAVEAIHFEETPARSSLDWHDAPIAQYVITLAGKLEFKTGGGEVFRLEPGDVLIALDTTGSGHTWRLVDDQPWKRAYVRFAGNGTAQFEADRK
jgi:quercetin dioxygenase-like cupin family protein